MIQKKYRLKEREVKKVLAKGKPFFSYTLVFNVLPSKLPYGKFAIVIGGKSVPNSVIRNVYRRKFYDISKKYLNSNFGNIVCVVKKKTKLLKDEKNLLAFEKELLYLFDKKLWKNT